MGSCWLPILLLFYLLNISIAADNNERPKALAAPTGENAVDHDEPIVVTLGPPKDGIQRAVLDEVAGNTVMTDFSGDDSTRLRPGEVDAYDDNFVDLREEQPIFIPRPYRNETTQSPPVTQRTIGRTMAPVRIVTQPRRIQTTQSPPTQTPRPQPQPQPRPVQVVQPQPQPQPQQTQPAQLQPQPHFQPVSPVKPQVQPTPQGRPTQPFQSRPTSQTPQQQQQQSTSAWNVAQQPQQSISSQPAAIRPITSTVYNATHRTMQRLLKWPNELPRPANDNPDRPKMSDGWRCYASAVQLEAGRGWRCYHRPSYRNKQQQQQPITLPPTLPPFPQPPRQPIRPRPQPPHSPPRIHVPTQTSPVMAQNLRTGVCHASIFYISSPMQSPSRLTFTHFAITISVDQCARTCHEFNCAIAHYDPSNGHCQFNPSTAFSVREGQCPRWPAVHYRNNVITREAIRIFCVQCHRPFRRGRGRFRGGRFRTRIVQTQFTGRVPASLRSAVVARSAKHSFEPIILGDSVAGHVKGHLVRQPQAANVDAEPLEANSEKKQSDNSGDRDAVDITELGHQMEATSGGLSLKQQEALPSSKITKENSSEAQIAFE